VLAHPGHTCRRSDWLLARLNTAIIGAGKPVDNHIALIGYR
jgi:hypothetical protein